VTRAVTLALVSLAVASIAGQVPQRDRPRARATGDSSIAGIVVSDDDEPRPLRRARVTLQGSGLAASEIAITQDDGSFTFAGLPPGRYSVSAAKSAYVEMSYGATAWSRPGALLTLAAGERRTVTIRLPRGAVITGVLTDAAGQPMTGLSVMALSDRYSPAAGERHMVPAPTTPSTTDDNGVYRIFGLPPGDYVVATQARQTTTALATVTPADVRAALAEVRSSTVNDRRIPSTLMPKASPPSKADVVLAPIYYPGTAVSAQAARVSVGKGEERGGIDFQVAPIPAAMVWGSVPTMPRTSIVLTRRDEPLPPSAGVRLASIDPFGRFAFPAVLPGRYTVSALTIRPGATPNKRDVQWATSEITMEGEEVAAALSFQPAFAISGRIVFEGGVQPMSPMRLPLPIGSPIRGAPGPEVELEGDGRFTISGLVGGHYRIGQVPGVRSRLAGWWLKSFTLGGREMLDAPLDLQSGSADAVVTFSDRATELSGRVASSTPQEQPSVFVIVFATNRASWFPHSRRVAGVRPDDQGRYRISNLPPGEYFAVVEDNVAPNEWFDSVLLDRLSARAVRIALGPNEARTQDFIAR
jgi:hypothetical protein